jgi:hypothetical protein
MHEKYGCVDVSPPILKLRNDPAGDLTLRLKQGDEYREYMVDIIDENAEDYLRSLKISFSDPLPPGCLTEVGQFHVNYTVATPWTNPPFVRVTRLVVIEDINECTLDVSKYKKSCPSLVPQCDIALGATCMNTIGSYACACPNFSSGDGFRNGSVFPGGKKAPESYKGGTGCVDTSLPVTTLLGPNPKSFQTCKCGGLSGIMSESPSGRDGSDQELQSSQRMLYGGDLKVRRFCLSQCLSLVRVFRCLTDFVTYAAMIALLLSQGNDSCVGWGRTLRVSRHDPSDTSGMCQSHRSHV